MAATGTAVAPTGAFEDLTISPVLLLGHLLRMR